MTQQPPNEAASRALHLLATRPTTPDWSAGYLDLLGTPEQVEPPSGLAQRLMRNELVTSIYEDHWRPALGRVLKGPRGPSMSGEVALAIDRLGLTPGATVLDVACGTGRFTRSFGSAVGGDGLAVGLDASRPMLDRAVARGAPHDPVAYVRADAMRPPFAEATMDGLCCFAALHMFADPRHALDAFTGVLKPGGRIVLLTSALRPRPPARILDELAGRLSGLHMFERGEVGDLLLERGFTDVVQDHTGLAQFVAGTLSR
ncbi:Methyltransferase domain-containing protein [Haloechinothrix alba]|uniref:Methyltransferase domain-containing protein n=1 Tax=Haloechinothrix alba TaxID=664784 RepID=A0A238Z933_9PSEU|nr:methyltransferase domain-containing protein [Haloechinothrix alba]SNR79780.1 Methyltransferase domain-containing protein [Haloechinothrix alba]